MPDEITRPQFFRGQFLRPEDLTAEQGYHLSMRRRHNVAHHRWGIVGGLVLEVTPEGEFVVQPGMAVDGYGRELILAERVTLSSSAFDEQGADRLGVWLAYDRVGADPSPNGYGDCLGSTSQYYRWREQPRIRLAPADDAAEGDPHSAPEVVPDGDRDFGPTRTAPDDPNQPWPVFLGQFFRDPADRSAIKADLAGRPYAGLVGEAITAPSGRAHVQVGSEKTGDHTRFAVFGTDPQGCKRTLLDIAEDGASTVHGDVTADGGLRVENGPLEFAPAEPPPQQPAQQPAPWRVYTVQAGQDHELRIELPNDPAAEFAVGAWSEHAFQACLVVDKDCNVTVNGRLHVTGGITEGADVVGSVLGGQAAATATGAFLAGTAGAGGLLERLYRRVPTDVTLAAATLAAIADDAAQLPGILGALSEPQRAALRAALAEMG